MNLRILLRKFNINKKLILLIMNINLVLLDNIDLKNAWEGEWINYLLDTCNIENIYSTIQIVKNPIVIFKGHNNDILNLIRLYEENNIYWIGFHLADEKYDTTTSYLNYKNCITVFKNYYNRNLLHPKLQYFALGYINELPKYNLNLDIYDKKYIWSFLGDVYKSNRMYYINKFIDINPHYIHKTTCFDLSNHKNGNNLTRKDYTEIMSQSIFCISPIGNINLDCFRLYEALECNTIPITIQSTDFQPYNYWTSLFETDNIPFIIANNFDEAKLKMKKILDNPELLVKTAHNCQKFWNDYKTNLKDLIKSIITLAYQ